MLTNARQKMIETIALRDGEVIISKVAKELGVSIETIRRDINTMCKQELLIKVHGGAVPAQLPISEASYRQRKKSNSAVKNRIGKAAASLIKSNNVVALSTGSTMEAVAAQISNVHNVCTLTNSLPIGQILTELTEQDSFNGRVILFGGELHPTEHLTYGTAVLEQIKRYYADIAFISAAAVSEHGLMTTGTDEGNITSALMNTAATVVLVIESKKLGKRSVYRYAGLEQIDVIVTDDENPISDALMRCFEENNIDLHVISK